MRIILLFSFFLSFLNKIFPILLIESHDLGRVVTVFDDSNKIKELLTFDWTLSKSTAVVGLDPPPSAKYIRVTCRNINYKHASSIAVMYNWLWKNASIKLGNPPPPNPIIRHIFPCRSEIRIKEKPKELGLSAIISNLKVDYESTISILQQDLAKATAMILFDEMS
jgi:hypothetical protein